MNKLDLDLLHVLNKTLLALDRIQRSLLPLLESQAEETRAMPEIPSGLVDCPMCFGDGYVAFIDPETDLWTSKKCECIR